MNFLLWVCRSMHLFGLIVWLGGFMYQSAILLPVFDHEKNGVEQLRLRLNRRFIGFIWMSTWTVLITGILLMLMNPNFMWFRFESRWQLFLGLKQLLFILMLIYSLGYSRMVTRAEQLTTADNTTTTTDLIQFRLRQYSKLTIALGIAALLLAVGMVI